MNCREVKPHLLLLTAAEQAELGTHPITRSLEVEAAMCAWEHLLDTHPDGFDDLGGAGQARMTCAELAPAIHYGYHIANVDDRIGGHAFDWEFVPWFLDNCVIWDDKMAYIHGCPDLADDWVEKCRVCLTEPEPEPEPEPTDEELLRQSLRIFNELPNQMGSYDLAARISHRLKRDAA